MKALWRDIKSVIILFLAWRFFLIVIQIIAAELFPLREDFLGPNPWSNFDGVHYLSIAQAGYRQYLEAFFPLYPLLIRVGSTPYSALLISHASFFVGLYFFMKFGGARSLPFFLLFPTSFFFAAVYPESLYMALAAGTLYAIVKGRWQCAGLLGLLASATRVFGVYLLIPAVLEYSRVKRKRIKDILSIGLMPVGLIVFMLYLWQRRGDPLAFFHVQPVFGAGRSGGEFIYLPQVLWRYIKIFFTADFSFVYTVALFEFATFVFALILLAQMWKKKTMKSYFWYCLAVIITPTLTGTLSSFPRYILAAFPLFFVIDTYSVRTKYLLAGTFVILLMYFASAFLRGYFVA